MSSILEGVQENLKNREIAKQAMAKEAELKTRALEDSAYNKGTQDVSNEMLIQMRQDVGNYLSNLVQGVGNPVAPIGQVIGSKLYDTVQGVKDRVSNYDFINNESSEQAAVNRQLGAEVENRLQQERNVTNQQDLDYLLKSSNPSRVPEMMKEHDALLSKSPNGVLNKDDMIFLLRNVNN